MKKLIAILLTVAMLMMSVCALAEEVGVTTEALEEGVEEVTDDIDVEEEEAALEEEAEAYETIEAETADVAEIALVNDRKINAEISVTTAEDFLPALNGLVVKTGAQNNGINHFDYAVTYGGEEYTGEVNYVDNVMYVRCNALGETMYAIDMTDLIGLVQSLLGFFSVDESAIDIPAFMEATNLQDLSLSSLQDLDLSALDLSPMMMAMMNLYKCVTIEDVEDYAIDSDIVDVDTEEAYEEVEVHEHSEAAMIVNAVLSADDMAILVNSIAATIAANENVFNMFGINAYDFSTTAHALLDTFSEDLAISAALDAEGQFLYGSLDYSVEDVASYRIQLFKDTEETGTMYTANILMTTDDTEEYITVFSAVVALDVNSVVVSVLQGDPADSASGFVFTGYVPYGEITDYCAEVDTISVVDGETSYPFSVVLNGTMDTDGVDFSAKGAFTIATENATVNLLNADITIATAPAEEIDLSAAVDLSEMDAGEDTDIFGDLVAPAEDIVE